MAPTDRLLATRCPRDGQATTIINRKIRHREERIEGLGR